MQAPTDAEQWNVFGEVLDAYVTEWSALPADDAPIGYVEAVEEAVDSFAESRDFDNDNYEDVTPIVGPTCFEELDEAFGE